MGLFSRLFGKDEPSYGPERDEAEVQRVDCFYAMAYFAMPTFLGEEQAEYLQGERAEPLKFLWKLYLYTCGKQEMEPSEADIHAFSAEEVDIDATRQALIFGFPSTVPVDLSAVPEDKIFEVMQQGKTSLAPYFAALVFDPDDKTKLYILGQSVMGGTTFRTVDGEMNANLGPGCEPDRAVFTAFLRQALTAVDG